MTLTLIRAHFNMGSWGHQEMSGVLDVISLGVWSKDLKLWSFAFTVRDWEYVQTLVKKHDTLNRPLRWLYIEYLVLPLAAVYGYLVGILPSCPK